MATERTRQQILDVAEQLFLHHGPNDASMRQITRAAGVGLAAVNYHFGSKENLIAEVASRVTAGLWSEQERALRKLEETQAAPTMAAIVDTFLAPYSKFVGGRDGRERIGLVMQILGGPPSRARERLVVSLEPLDELLPRLVVKANPSLSQEEASFRVSSLVAVVIFYLQGGFDPTANPSGLRSRWTVDNAYLVEHLSTMLAAPPSSSAGRVRRRAA